MRLLFLLLVSSYCSFRCQVRFFGGRAVLRCDSLQFGGPLARSCVASETKVRVGICTQRGETGSTGWASYGPTLDSFVSRACRAEGETHSPRPGDEAGDPRQPMKCAGLESQGRLWLVAVQPQRTVTHQAAGTVPVEPTKRPLFVCLFELKLPSATTSTIDCPQIRPNPGAYKQPTTRRITTTPQWTSSRNLTSADFLCAHFQRAISLPQVKSRRLQLQTEAANFNPPGRLGSPALRRAELRSFWPAFFIHILVFFPAILIPTCAHHRPQYGRRYPPQPGRCHVRHRRHVGRRSCWPRRCRCRRRRPVRWPCGAVPTITSSTVETASGSRQRAAHPRVHPVRISFEHQGRTGSTRFRRPGTDILDESLGLSRVPLRPSAPTASPSSFGIYELMPRMRPGA